MTGPLGDFSPLLPPSLFFLQIWNLQKGWKCYTNCWYTVGRRKWGKGWIERLEDQKLKEEKEERGRTFLDMKNGRLKWEKFRTRTVYPRQRKKRKVRRKREKKGKKEEGKEREEMGEESDDRLDIKNGATWKREQEVVREELYSGEKEWEREKE